MSLIHIALAVLVALIWGFNFVAIKLGLGSMPPLLFSALRFVLAAAPFLPFYRSPGVAMKWVIGIGLALGVGQFGLLFTAMNLGMPAGLSSAVLQTQVFFTTLFAALTLGERPGIRQMAGVVIAFAGVLTIAGSLDFGALGPFLMVIAAAACWATSNILTRRAKAMDPMRLMVWVSLVPPLPLGRLRLPGLYRLRRHHRRLRPVEHAAEALSGGGGRPVLAAGAAVRAQFRRPDPGRKTRPAEAGGRRLNHSGRSRQFLAGPPQGLNKEKRGRPAVLPAIFSSP